jgi:hypothetical protein
MTEDFEAKFNRMREKVGGKVVPLTAPGARKRPDKSEAKHPQPADGGGDTDKGAKQADLLIKLADDATLYHTADGTAFADIDVSGHRETLAVRHRGFKRWLAKQYFDKTRKAPGSEALQAALNVIEARAHFGGVEREVHVRVGGADGRVFIDLGDSTWQAIEVSAQGWNVIAEPPVRFRRAAGMKALPIPVRGGSVDLLRHYLNVAHDEDFVLTVAWLVAALRPRGPYPVLLVNGEQGSAKSTFCAVVRSLVDPNSAPLRALPREDRDLFINASNAHVLAFDNVSNMPAWTSDTLCRLSSGGGFSVRKLYSDGDEELFDAARPTILNGIDSVISRPDLADRSLFLSLDPISDEARRPEQELVDAFERDRPAILGALLDGVARGLRDLDHVRLDRLPRMADFALWAAASESTFWPAGTFSAAYSGNRADVVSDVLDADAVAMATIAYLKEKPEPVALTAAALLALLGEIVSQQQRKAKSWPDTPRALSSRLRRSAPFLRKAGIVIDFGDREPGTGARLIRLARDGRDGVPSGCPQSEAIEG